MDVVASSRFQLWWLVDVSVLYSRAPKSSMLIRYTGLDTTKKVTLLKS